MAIVEIQNPRREKSGEEKFDIVVSPAGKSAVGDQMVTILRAAYEKAITSGYPYFRIPTDDSVTRTAIWILTDLVHLLAVGNRQHKFENRNYIITQGGMAVAKHFFPLD